MERSNARKVFTRLTFTVGAIAANALTPAISCSLAGILGEQHQKPDGRWWSARELAASVCAPRHVDPVRGVPLPCGGTLLHFHDALQPACVFDVP